MVGTYSFDSEATPLSQTATFASYGLLDHRMTLNGIPFVGTDVRIDVANDEPFENALWDGYQATASTTGTFNGNGIYQFRLEFLSDTAEPLTSLALPLTEDELAAFDVKRTVVSKGFPPPRSHITGTLTRLEFLTGPLAAECEGFAAPFDARIGLNKREQRVIPLRMELFDGDFPLGPNDIAAPIVSVSYSSTIIGGSELEQLVESPGKASSGNSFVWDESSQRWAFNLATKPYTAAGTYTVTAVAGDEDYLLSPTCSGTFVRQ